MKKNDRVITEWGIGTIAEYIAVDWTVDRYAVLLDVTRNGWEEMLPYFYNHEVYPLTSKDSIEKELTEIIPDKETLNNFKIYLHKNGFKDIVQHTQLMLAGMGIDVSKKAIILYQAFKQI